MLCIRNGVLVLPGGLRRADLYLRGGEIFSVGGHWAGAEELDADGCYVFPGFLDGDVSEAKDRVQLAEYTEGALLGGYTTVGWPGEEIPWRGRVSCDVYTLPQGADGASGAWRELLRRQREEGVCLDLSGREEERVRREEEERSPLERRSAVILDKLSGYGEAGLREALRVLCEEPAQRAGLYPRKGVLRVRSAGDVTVWDPDWMGEGAITQGRGRARSVLLGGRLVAGRGILLRYGQGRLWEHIELRGGAIEQGAAIFQRGSGQGKGANAVERIEHRRPGQQQRK